jgi:uncharacterized protein (TIGR02444 family)
MVNMGAVIRCRLSGRRLKVLRARFLAAEAGDTARAWQETAIGPLRAVRRALKARAPDLDDTDREAVRAQVKAVELEAERRLLTALEKLSPAPSGLSQPPINAMVAAARVWSPMTPRAGLVRLADRLPA